MLKYNIGDKVRIEGHDNDLTIISLQMRSNWIQPEYELMDKETLETFEECEEDLLIPVVEDDDLLSSVSLLNALQSNSCELDEEKGVKNAKR